MMRLDGDQIVFAFPEVHPEASVRVSFIRLLRDETSFGLTTRLGDFPLTALEDCVERAQFAGEDAPTAFFPIYQSEALSLLLRTSQCQFAIKIGVGEVNGFSGRPWSEDWSEGLRDYAVVSGHLFIDRFRFAKARVGRFVAPPLDLGTTRSTTGLAALAAGAIRIAVAPMKESARAALPPPGASIREESESEFDASTYHAFPPDLPLDHYGIGAWEVSSCRRCTVYALNSQRFVAVAGARPFTRPRTRADFDRAGLTWRDEYGADRLVLG